MVQADAGCEDHLVQTIACADDDPGFSDADAPDTSARDRGRGPRSGLGGPARHRVRVDRRRPRRAASERTPDNEQPYLVQSRARVGVPAAPVDEAGAEVEDHTVKSSPYIKECIVFGEGRKYVSALIQIDLETVAKWGQEHGSAYTNFRNLEENPAIRELIDAEIQTANGQLAKIVIIRRFHLLTKELDHDDGVTATMKVRRANIQQKNSAEIAGLYAPAR